MKLYKLKSQALKKWFGWRSYTELTNDEKIKADKQFGPRAFMFTYPPTIDYIGEIPLIIITGGKGEIFKE